MNIAFRVLQLNSGKTYSRKLLLGRGKFFCVLEAWKSKPVAAPEQCGSQWLGLYFLVQEFFMGVRKQNAS